MSPPASDHRWEGRRSVTTTMRPIPDAHASGRRAEDRAHAYLCEHGLRSVARNFRCRHGELDLIMRDGNTVVIVEVRSRASAAFMDPRESIGTTKKQRLLRATRHLLSRRPELARDPIRFDVVTLCSTGKGDSLAWIPDAFDGE